MLCTSTRGKTAVVYSAGHVRIRVPSSVFPSLLNIGANRLMFVFLRCLCRHYLRLRRLGLCASPDPWAFRHSSALL